jgi:hypothetical protein
MFRALLCSSSGGQNCIFTASGIVTLCERPYMTYLLVAFRNFANAPKMTLQLHVRTSNIKFRTAVR